MDQRVLFVPYPHVPEPEDVPALRAIIHQFERASFTVETFRWPYLLGERDAATWQGSSLAIARQLRPRDHVVAFGCGLWMALLGVQQAAVAILSIACATLAIPSRTLEVLGLSGMARVGDQSHASTNVRWVRRRLAMMMQQATDREIDSFVSAFLDQVDAGRHDAFLESHENLDVTAELDVIDTPALYLELKRPPGQDFRAMDVGVLLPQPEGEDRELFRRFVPNVSVGSLSVFPTRLQEAESAQEVWRQIVPFMVRHSAEERVSSASP